MNILVSKYKFGAKYILFSRSFVLSVIVSIITLPVIIHFAGIQTWTSIVAGQGLGLVLAEFVDGGWTRIAPQINSKFKADTIFIYVKSLAEKSCRFLVATLIGTSVIFLTHKEFFLYAELSFLGWLLNGLSPMWLTIGTGESKYMLKYWTVPRVISIMVGIFFLYLDFYFWSFLVIQIFANVLSIIRLSHNREKSAIDFEFSEFLGLREQRGFIIGGMVAAASSWLLIFLLSLSTDKSATSLVALFRYAELVYALAYIFPQSRHGSLATSKDSIARINSHRNSNYFTFFIIFCSFLSFSYMNELLFHGEVNVTKFQLICVLSTVPIRIFFQLIIQDNLIPKKKNILAMFFNITFSTTAIFTFFFVITFFDEINTMPFVYIVLNGMSLIIFYVFFEEVKDEVKQTIKIKNKK